MRAASPRVKRHRIATSQRYSGAPLLTYRGYPTASEMFAELKRNWTAGFSQVTH